MVPICIPGSSETFAEKTGWVTGYGSLYSGGSVHNKLQYFLLVVLFFIG